MCTAHVQTFILLTKVFGFQDSPAVAFDFNQHTGSLFHIAYLDNWYCHFSSQTTIPTNSLYKMVPFIHQDSRTSSCADFRIDSTPLLRCVSIVCTTCIEQRELGVDCKQFYFPYQVIGVATHQ